MVVFLRLAGVAHVASHKPPLSLSPLARSLADRVLRRDDQRVQLGHRLIVQLGLVA
jgi:hypothetical protein